VTVRAALTSIAAVALPRHRAWKRLLDSLTLDPERLPSPLPPPGPHDFLMCGSSRSGTALLVAALYQPPRVVTVMEPWDALRLPPRELFASLRAEIRGAGRLSRGRLDIADLEANGAVTWCRDGERPHEVPVDGDDFLLGVKLPAFWRYLDRLPDSRFLICLRHPLEVVRSYERTGGRLRDGLDYDVPFNREMNDWLMAATDDPAVRRVLLYEYVHKRILPHLDRPNVLAVRYERWFTEPEAQLAEISSFLGTPVESFRVRLRAPRSAGEATPEEKALLHTHCRTASLLGYET
jgi:hypothetical protein